MAHTRREKAKLLSRVRRIRGQVEALERALEAEKECTDILQLVAACRGALNSLMAELIDGQVWFHVLPPNRKNHKSQMEAAEQLLNVVRTYLK
jgi:DNA-binding FrmR family transcriptional regulator